MNKYTKLQQIGKGSFGSAFIVVRRNDVKKIQYVLKEITLDPRDQAIALREAKLLSALNHPNIIACKESFMVKDKTACMAKKLCIVTEYADGGDLQKYIQGLIRRKSYLCESDILDLFIQTCLAIKHLHDRKIIHRDIKPENIFLMKPQSLLKNDRVVKLGDFGVATVLTYTLAQAKTLTGTPYYTSPEICQGKPYTTKTDIWSLGCVLYQLITLVHPFTGRSQRQLFENIINCSYEPIVNQSVSDGVKSLVKGMLMKDPLQRPSVHQIIRLPVIMNRVCKFLSDKALNDELSHTTLHGACIFKQNVSKSLQSNLAINSVPAGSSQEKKICNKAVIIKRSGADDRLNNQNILPPRPTNLRGNKGHSNNSKMVNLSRKMQVLNRKSRSPLKNYKLSIDNQGEKKLSNFPPPAPSRVTSTKLICQSDKKVVDTPVTVCNRVASFNKQWNVQKKNLLNGIKSKAFVHHSECTGSSPLNKLGVCKARALYPKPVVVSLGNSLKKVSNNSSNMKRQVGKATKARPDNLQTGENIAAQRRCAMKKDIQRRKLQLKCTNVQNEVLTYSDMPIIFVQKLTKSSSLSSAKRTDDSSIGLDESNNEIISEFTLPPPPPISIAVGDSKDFKSKTHAISPDTEEVVGRNIENDEQKLTSSDITSPNGEATIEADEDGQMQSYSESKRSKSSSLDYQRMIIELQKIAEASDSEISCDSTDNEDEEEADRTVIHEEKFNDQYENAVESTTECLNELQKRSDEIFIAQPTLHALDISILQDSTFQSTLRDMINGYQECIAANSPDFDIANPFASTKLLEIASKVPVAQQEALYFCGRYILQIVGYAS